MVLLASWPDDDEAKNGSNSILTIHFGEAKRTTCTPGSNPMLLFAFDLFFFWVPFDSDLPRFGLNDLLRVGGFLY